MKAVILAGGSGTRLSEETEVRPKPMVEIGGRPILWHIMKHYAHARLQRVRRRARLQGRGHQALLPRLPLAERRPRRSTSARGRSSRTAHRARGLDRPPGRHRRRDQHRRPRPAAAAWLGDGTVHAHLRRRRLRRRPAARCSRSTARTGKLATVTAVRPPARFGGLIFDGDGRSRLHREAADRRGLDQRRVHGARARRARLHRRRRDELRGRRRSSGWRTRASWSPTGTTASGSAWTRCATCATCSTSLWDPATRPGRCGRERRDASGADRASSSPARPAGRRLARAATCSTRGADVVGLVRDWDAAAELAAAGADRTAAIVDGDVRDRRCVERLLGEHEVDTVIHLAAQTIVGAAHRNPVATFETQRRGHLDVLEACRRDAGRAPSSSRRSRQGLRRPRRSARTRGRCRSRPPPVRRLARRAPT